MAAQRGWTVPRWELARPSKGRGGSGWTWFGGLVRVSLAVAVEMLPTEQRDGVLCCAVWGERRAHVRRSCRAVDVAFLRPLAPPASLSPACPQPQGSIHAYDHEHPRLRCRARRHLRRPQQGRPLLRLSSARAHLGQRDLWYLHMCPYPFLSPRANGHGCSSRSGSSSTVRACIATWASTSPSSGPSPLPAVPRPSC